MNYRLYSIFLAYILLSCTNSFIKFDPVSRIDSSKALYTPFYDHFDNYDTTMFEKSDKANYGDFYCSWLPSHTTFNNDSIMRLTLTDEHSYYMFYSSGEYKTIRYYGYGTYETRIKTAGVLGTNTSFFTYTNENGVHDEIDFEILCYDPISKTQKNTIQLNYYVNGTGGHEFYYYPTWDPSAGFHTYKIDWTPHYITWYIDDVAVHSVTDENGSKQLPSNRQKVMMNLWNGSPTTNWLGVLTYTVPITAYYDYIKYTPYSYYTQDEQGLKNGDFIQGTSNWDLTTNGTASATFNANNSVANVQINNWGSGTAEQIALSQSGIKFNYDNTYTVSFDISADIGGKIIRTYVRRENKNFYPYSLIYIYYYDQPEYYINISTTTQRFSFTFYMYDPDDYAKLVFDLSYNNANDNNIYHIDNVTISSVSGYHIGIPDGLLKNSTFDYGTVPPNNSDKRNWELYTQNGFNLQDTTFSCINRSYYNSSDINREALIRMNKGGGQPSDIRLRQAGLKLENGKIYELSFDVFSYETWNENGLSSDIKLSAWASTPRSIGIVLSKDAYMSETYLIKTLILEPVFIRQYYRFVMSGADNNNSWLQFNLGGDSLYSTVKGGSSCPGYYTARDVAIDNVILKEVSSLDPTDDNLITEDIPSVDWQYGGFSFIIGATKISGNDNDFTIEFPLKRSANVTRITYDNFWTQGTTNCITNIVIIAVDAGGSTQTVFSGAPNITGGQNASTSQDLSINISPLTSASKFRIEFKGVSGRAVFVVKGVYDY